MRKNRVLKITNYKINVSYKTRKAFEIAFFEIVFNDKYIGRTGELSYNKIGYEIIYTCTRISNAINFEKYIFSLNKKPLVYKIKEIKEHIRQKTTLINRST